MEDAVPHVLEESKLTEDKPMKSNNNEGKKTREVRFRDDIPQHVKDDGTVFNQKKIGPIGRRRLSNQHSVIRRRLSSGDSRKEKQPPGAKGLGNNIKMTPLGFELLPKGEIKPASSPKAKLKSWFNWRPRTWSSWSGKAPRNIERKDVDRLDDNGLSALHTAAYHNSVDRVEELLRRGANVNVKSSLDRATPLHMAARYNCLDVTMVLLQHGADVSKTLYNGHTPLHVCCRRGYVKVAKALIYTGEADVNALDIDKTTPLQQATVKGDIEVCTLLVESGAKIYGKDINQVSPVMQAAQGGHQECVQYLLTLGLQIGIPISEFLTDKDNEGNTALHLAVGNRHLLVAKSLIERGAPVNGKKSTNGFTPLHQAAVMGLESMAKMIIDKGGETEATDNEQMTPLHRAALYNRVDTVLLLIRQGLFLDSQDEDNFTPLLCAAWKGQTEAGRSLLRYGANIKALDKEMKSCLHWAVEMQQYEFIEMLFEYGHDGKDIIDWKDRRDQTALHYAAEVGNPKILNLLMENGADLTVRDGEEKTPLHIASEFGHLQCTDDLLQACPVPLNDDDIDDMTPLLLASVNGHHRVVQFLITVGADIESRNDERRSSLALAAQHNNMKVVHVLINNSSNVNAVDKDKNTPLHLCAQAGHAAPVTLLLSSGADLRLQNTYGMYPLDVAIENKREGVAKAILSCKSWEVAMNNTDDAGYTPMRKLVAILPGAALQVLNQCVIKSHADLHHPDLKVTYNYRYIDPGPDDISFNKNGLRYFALETMVEFRREKLLAHKLSQTCLSKKWNRFARYFNYVEFLYYVTFMVLVSVYLHISLDIERNVTGFDETGCPFLDITNETDVQAWIEKGVRPEFEIDQNATLTHSHLIFTDGLAIGIQFFILCFVLIRCAYEIIGILKHRVAYFRKAENLLHWTMIIPTFFFVFPPFFPPCSWSWQTGVISVFVTWMNFIFVLNRFDFFGLYVTMFFTTLKSLIKAMSVYIFFIVGFALAFYICFQSHNPSFRNEWTSIITTFVMTLGEINKSDLLDTGVDMYPFEEIANILVIAFLFLMPMVLINLTIGISVGDIEQILEASYFKRFSLQVEIILSIEKRFPRGLQRRTWLPKAVYRPNKRKHPILRKIAIFAGGAKTKFLKKSSEEANKEISNRDVMLKISRHDDVLSTLTGMVHEQGKLLSRIAQKHDIKSELDSLYSSAPLSGAGRP